MVPKDGLNDTLDGQIVLDGNSLTLAAVERYLESEHKSVGMAPLAVDALRAANNQLRQWIHDGVPIYGMTRGLGPLKNTVLNEDEEMEFQRRILLSHATGIGDYFSDQIATVALLLRANEACSGHFGIRPELVQRILDVLNAGVIPLMHTYGSIGSGDLQPMAALGLVITGDPHGRARWRGHTGPAPDILVRAGLEPNFALQCGEALAIISGSTVLAAGTLCALISLGKQLKVLDGACALTMEALRAESDALDPRVHTARRIPGQIESAAHMRRLLRGSQWTTAEGRRRLGEIEPRVQDAVSLRSSPHIHGALGETINFVRAALEREINAATMNPLMFRNESNPDGYDVLACGNYDGSYLAHLLDFLNIALTDCVGLSMTRASRLISPQTSYGLPPNLAGGAPGLNSGLIQVHSLQVSILGQMRQQANPASIHSLVAKGMQEDHNSMGNSSLHDLLVNIRRTDTVLAGEILLAAQAVSLIESRMTGLSLGEGTRALIELVRTEVATQGDDRYFSDDLEAVVKMVRHGEVLDTILNHSQSSDRSESTIDLLLQSHASPDAA